ncbi:MAG TPA: glycerate kinase [Acidimicrobiales bacterium]|nr:glycerate kinase [Acidimicrobiales bacterium]
MPHVLAAPDKYRGTLSALEAGKAVARAAADAGWSCDVAPMSDGREGFLEAFGGFGRHQSTRVTGPLGARVEVRWLLGRDSDDPNLSVAVVESALAIGLSLAGGAEANDPVRASSAGLGQLVVAAAKAGAKQVLVGLGGTATTDGGLGAVDALAPNGRSPNVEILVACDVETKFLEAAAIFSPQKGAAPAQVELLTRRLERVAQLYEERFGVDVRALPGGGAAGGLAGGLAAVGAKLLPGFDLVADRLSLAERIASADLVVTGEGYVDGRSLAGKVVGGVARLAGLAAVPVLVVAGDGDPAVPLPFVSLVDRFGADRSWSSPGDCITEVVQERLARGRAS